MTEHSSYTDVPGLRPEAILEFAKHLGKSKLRRDIFNNIYGRDRKFRSKKQIMAAAGIVNRGTKSQQVQNELDTLAKHRLIAKIKNDGSVDDGSHYLYGKDQNIRAARDRITHYADRP